MKIVDVKNPITNEIISKGLTVIPIKERKALLTYYHYITGHKNYHILHDKIISEGYYWNNITDTCKSFINGCTICNNKNKSTLLPPPTNQIICKKPRELYLIDITEVPHELNDNAKKKIYLLSILDHFSKYAKNYIINKKDDKTVIKKIVDFIDNNGLPEKILTDNGGEFRNKLFKKYCKNNDIVLLHGRPRHPQTQGAVERYNRTIKDLLKNIYIEKNNNGESFNLQKELDNAINIYNNTKHSTIGFSPNEIFNSNDKKLFDIVRNKTLLSQKYHKNMNNPIVEKRSALLCEKFKLYGNKLKMNTFGRKGRYIIPVTIIKSSSTNEYIINIAVKHNLLEKNKSYFAEYCLLKLCDEKIWNELVLYWENSSGN